MTRVTRELWALYYKRKKVGYFLPSTCLSYSYGVGWLSVTGLVEGLYILHDGKLTAVGGRFLYARHLEHVVFDLGGLPLRP